MTRHVLTLRSDADRFKVIEWLKRAAYGHRIEVKEPKRSDMQNDRMWAMLGDVARQGTINGRKFTPDEWKCIFMQALGREVAFLPTLNSSGFFPTGFRSSDLTVREMSDLQTFIEAYAAENDITLREQPQ
jgi:hypothetical protein